MKFYYNADLNICADRDWVVEYLFMGGLVESRENAEDGLDAYRIFFGWHDCEVHGVFSLFSSIEDFKGLIN